MSAMGVQRSEMLSSKPWLTGLDTKGKLVPEACRALLRIYINVTYRNLTQVLTDQIRFNSWRVSQEVCRDFMSSILAYQKERQEFFLGRKHTILQHILPKKAVAQASPLGELDPLTGRLKIKTSIETIIKRFTRCGQISLLTPINRTSCHKNTMRKAQNDRSNTDPKSI